MSMLGTTETHIARKRHQCWWCGESIRPKSEYVSWAWKDGQRVSTVKTHVECQQAWGTLDYPEDEVDFAEFCRGCTCQHGDCRCEQERRDSHWLSG